MIKIQNLNKIYGSTKSKKCHALKNINLDLPDRGLVFICGKSGSGKSTFLNLIGGLDCLTSGEINVDGKRLSQIKERDFCDYRSAHIGFVFQDCYLIDEMTVSENIALSLDLCKTKYSDKIERALEKVGLTGFEDRYPRELSGGERQRVSIARALVKNPKLILADEPTGNLDSELGRSIFDLFKALSKECLVLVVSHDLENAAYFADRIIELSEGEIVSDRSKNPSFPETLEFVDDHLIYPEGMALNDGDIDFLNSHRTKKIIKKNGRYIDTKIDIGIIEKEREFENSGLSFGRLMRLSWIFLKRKMVGIVASIFMVAAIMLIMLFSQTVVSFDANNVIQDEINQKNHSSLVLSKYPLKEVSFDSDFRGVVTGDDIAAFEQTGFNGTIYPIYNPTVAVTSGHNALGRVYPYFQQSIYITETLGTMIVDEGYLQRKFGEEITYLAKADEENPIGVLITDYVADSIIATCYDSNITYEDLLGAHMFGVPYKTVRTYINGIIYTGYKEEYGELFDRALFYSGTDFAKLMRKSQFEDFVFDVYDKLGYSYTFNPNYVYDYENSDDVDIVWTFRTYVNGDRKYSATNGHYGIKDLHNQFGLGPAEVVLSLEAYNAYFETDYTRTDCDTFVPHDMEIAVYRMYDLLKEHCLFSSTVHIKAISADIAGAMVLSEDLYSKYAEHAVTVQGLYFDDLSGVFGIFDLASEMGFVGQSQNLEGIYTMTKVVDAFIPIFRWVSIFLCIGIVLILMRFLTQTIKSKLYEIGILKALGMKNMMVGWIFGLQTIMIAVFTSLLATIGYYFFIDWANVVLIGSIEKIVGSHIIIDFDLLSYQPNVVLVNCLAVFLLALLSLIVPMVKIKMIKPMSIIKAKE
ncbi:MAG: ATP-binding cassette domain-containing protein [Clostridia bacterium]|nr:ATP-binding cassette domain-containing protein [Clostridia bacterium]